MPRARPAAAARWPGPRWPPARLPRCDPRTAPPATGGSGSAAPPWRSCYMTALHATPAASDAVRRPLLPLLDRVRHLAAGVRLLRPAALDTAECNSAPGALAGRVDGVRHPPGWIHLDHARAARVRVRAPAAGVPRISAGLRRTGIPLRRDVLCAGLGGPAHALAGNGAAPAGAGGDGVRLSPALPELHRRGADAVAPAGADRRSRRAADPLRAPGRGERSVVRRAGSVADGKSGAPSGHGGFGDRVGGKRLLRVLAPGARPWRGGGRSED